MMDQLFRHLAQYADEIKSSSQPAIECTLFKSLENVHISHTNEPSLTAEYRTSSPIDLSAASASSSTERGRQSLPRHPSEGLDPVACLRYSSVFHFAQHSPESISPSPTLFPFELAHSERESNDSVISVAGSSICQSSDETDPFCISSPDHSLVSSDNGAAEWASQLKQFNPFADPLFYLPFRPRGCNGETARRFSRISELQRSRLAGSDEREDDWVTPNVDLKFLSGEPTSIIPDMDTTNIPPPTNVFVANFPSHWVKSDLWDLFEGIPVTTVHVLPEKRAPNEETIYGGTGFVNITRASDAHALLALLDKKIWLIDGSALKFRLANSCPPTEPMNFHVSKKNRTVRRHQHKVIDRLRAEQTVGNKQLACCDRHQIVVYQNIPAKDTHGPNLSVVHGSRQRNTHFVCNGTETSLAGSVTRRPFLEFLKSHLSRRNHYNTQQLVASSTTTKPNPARISSPVPVPVQQAPLAPLDQGISTIQRVHFQQPTSAYPSAYHRTADAQGGLDIHPQTIAHAPSAIQYSSWPPNPYLNAQLMYNQARLASLSSMYNQVNAPSLSLRWVSVPHSPYSQAQHSQLPQRQQTSSFYLPRIP
ncbi:hypothetical protein Pst134EA_022457 [Puccinia striiformis f. sp. tritici]|uniref:hypothetical protein n=1 Tax=Puccinia striiformis f. sp. tritici TaxID=168172 RepID=UPI0020084805|nr:hypothetical protein Pst134EA_022457 [Puccinia striiformis f. sp. tritici]KAH9454969.1 hypothetical protein Pst134EA_022457 [Puccinia striiformis f. sp. tritici]KAI9621571.1 hypothetical protein H4Q26_015577 [Puccinia striiformis f. sp. tritici PST-130]